MRGFVCIDDRTSCHVAGNQINSICLVARHERKGATLASTGDYDNAARAGLITLASTVNAILAVVGRADVATEVSAINFDFARNLRAFVFVLHGLAKLVSHDPIRLVLDAQFPALLESGATL